MTSPDAEVVRFLEGESGNGSTAIPFGTELPEVIGLGAEACVFGPGDIRVAHRTGEFVPLPELHQAADILRPGHRAFLRLSRSARIPAVALHFWKYHGLGNDFVVVEGGAPMAPGRAVAICDRHRGIGADGVLGVLPARDGGAARMHIFNPDGSVAAMCGNGIRCVARHLAETRAARRRDRHRDRFRAAHLHRPPRPRRGGLGHRGDGARPHRGDPGVRGRRRAGAHAPRLHGKPARRDPATAPTRPVPASWVPPSRRWCRAA